MTRRARAGPNFYGVFRNQPLGISLYRELNQSLIARLNARLPGEALVKLNNLKIAPKLGILLGVTLLGLSAAGILAGHLVQREMMAARMEQIHAVVDMARNMAAGLQKEVEAGKLSKEAAFAEFGKRANTLTYDNGSGYLFGNTMDGITVLAPDPSFIGKNRMDV